MAILEFSGTRPRNRIGFVEEEPPDGAVKALETLGGYELYKLGASHLAEPGRLATTGAVVFQQRPDKPMKVVRDLERFGGTLLNHDCRVFVAPVRAEAGANGARFREFIVNALLDLQLPPSGLSKKEATAFPEHLGGSSDSPRTPCIHVLEHPGDWSNFALLLRNNPPGAAPKVNLDIAAIDSEGGMLSLKPEHDVLLRRAFWDCASLQLVGLKNGLSDVSTFRAFAHLGDAIGTHTPFLYFVKIGARALVTKEYAAYCDSALEHIPYHLGPRLRQLRCALGHTQGILVGDYVSGAETLRDCARDGRAVPVIANLFNETLRAWHHGATIENRSFHEYLTSSRSLTIPVWRKPLIEQYGVSRSPGELQALVVSHNSHPVLVGVVHGDLHATNVLVRNQDAIVIDFEKVEERAPLLRDMASLEGGLFVDGFIGDHRTGRELLTSVTCLYEVMAFRDRGRTKCHPADGSAWFFECVHQIRMQARQVERADCQYALALAVALYRKGCNPSDFRGDTTGGRGLSREEVRALAYVLAERILGALSNGQGAQGGTP